MESDDEIQALIQAGFSAREIKWLCWLRDQRAARERRHAEQSEYHHIPYDDYCRLLYVQWLIQHNRINEMV